MRFRKCRNCLVHSQPAFLILPHPLNSMKWLLSKLYIPENFESHNSLKLSFTNIWGYFSNFAVCKSFYSVLVWKESATHACSCSFCEDQAFLCTLPVPLKLLRFIFKFLTDLTPFNVLLLFSLVVTTLFCLYSFWLFYVM